MAVSDDIRADADMLAYVESVSLVEPAVLAELREETARHPRGGMQITAMQGQLFKVVVAMTGARKALDIGTFTGYSSTALALALPADGKVVTLDISADYTAVARRYWKTAGVEGKVELKLAPGDASMAEMIARGEAGTFDIAFLDTGDKKDYPKFYELALRLLRPGGVMMVDNTLMNGRVVQAARGAPGGADTAKAMVAFNEALHKDARIVSVMLTIGDGLTVAVKR